MALREFFLPEYDKGLGRWRWPEDRTFVVYPLKPDDVRVLNEATGEARQFRRAVWASESPYREAAEAYFDAHPAPRPWHDAKPDQVWSAVVDSTGGVRPLTVMEYQDKSCVFLDAFHEYTYGLTDPCITDAQQIWPVESP